MQLSLTGKRSEAYNLSKKLVESCYALTHDLTPEEKTNLTQYIRTASVTLHLNIAQAVFISKKGKRKKYIKTAHQALIILNAAIGVLAEVKLATLAQVYAIQELSTALCQQLIALKKGK
jgi:four helix bundle protein